MWPSARSRPRRRRLRQPRPAPSGRSRAVRSGRCARGPLPRSRRYLRTGLDRYDAVGMASAAAGEPRAGRLGCGRGRRRVPSQDRLLGDRVQPAVGSSRIKIWASRSNARALPGAGAARTRARCRPRRVRWWAPGLPGPRREGFTYRRIGGIRRGQPDVFGHGAGKAVGCCGTQATWRCQASGPATRWTPARRRCYDRNSAGVRVPEPRRTSISVLLPYATGLRWPRLRPRGARGCLEWASRRVRLMDGHCLDADLGAEQAGTARAAEAGPPPSLR